MTHTCKHHEPLSVEMMRFAISGYRVLSKYITEATPIFNKENLVYHKDLSDNGLLLIAYHTDYGMWTLMKHGQHVISFNEELIKSLSVQFFNE